MFRKGVLEVFTFMLIALFLYASVSKLLEYQRFYVQVNQSPLLTGLVWIPPFTIGIELLTCCLLLIPTYRALGYFLSLGLMGSFTAYIVAILKYSPYVPCSCGGILESLGWREHLVFNVAFVLIALACCVLHFELTDQEYEEQLEELGI